MRPTMIRLSRSASRRPAASTCQVSHVTPDPTRSPARSQARVCVWARTTAPFRWRFGGRAPSHPLRRSKRRESGLFLRFADNVSQGAALGPVQDTALVQVIDSCDVDGLFSVLYGVSTGTFDPTIRDIACQRTHTAPTSIPCICSP